MLDGIVHGRIKDGRRSRTAAAASRMESARRTIFCLLVLVVGGASSIKNLKMTVPERVRVGDSALLTCSYDLEDAELYAIKWYLNEVEFYSYVPLKDPPHNIYDVDYVQVNASGSNMHDVMLVNVKPSNSGQYKCEASEDAPRYDTGIQSAYLSVVAE